MPSTEREESQDRDRSLVMHKNPSMDMGRVTVNVPMWDSSDPARAPPPLPLNPSSPSIGLRPNTSATVAAAAAALAEKARENAGPSSYTTNPMPKRDGSPEKSLINRHHHKRMQSFQTGGGSVRDISGFLDGSGFKTPERSPERGIIGSNSSSLSKDSTKGSPFHDRSPTPTPQRHGALRETPTLRSSTRLPPKSILGENTPPTSATLLAIQNMPLKHSPDAPLANITNSSTALVRTPQSFDAISTQILSLTTIATNLQREMSQLSRRSKDNATDLVSLKEATNARDEDIRKSLRELVMNLSSGPMAYRSDSSVRSSSQAGFHATPGNSRNLVYPRVSSPSSFAATLERELADSPSPFTIDGAASLALLEKILREMGTKEGQDRLLTQLSELASKSNAEAAQTVKKMEELFKNQSRNDAVILRGGNGSGGTRNGGDDNGTGAPRLELDFEDPSLGPLACTSKDITSEGPPVPPRGSRGSTARGRQTFDNPGASEFVSEDMLKLLRKIKDSVTESGCLTGETKALVRDLRGEVLGMGRDIARKLDEVDSSRVQNSRSVPSSSKTDIAAIIEEGLADLKSHMDNVLRDRRRQSISSTVSRNTVDSQEVYEAVKNAMNDLHLKRKDSVRSFDSGMGFGKEDILDAVREAWEDYKPHIEVQQIGLEREEILQCLKQGLESYQPENNSRDIGGASREEVLNAVREGLQSFEPPAPVESEASITREEIIVSVRECLESFEFPTMTTGAVVPVASSVSREDMLDAVREGLSTFNFPANHSSSSRDLDIDISKLDISKEEVLEAVRSSMGNNGGATRGMGNDQGDLVVQRLQDVMEGMHQEFKAVSDEAKQNVAANGRDTEQVLDAVKDGLEALRKDIEVYVDQVADDEEGRDEIIDTVHDSVAQLKIDLEAYIDKAKGHTNNELAEQFKVQIESLRESISTAMVRAVPEEKTDSMLSNTSELLDAFHEGLDGLRADVEKIIDKPIDMTVNYEILDALKEGLAEVRADIERVRESQGSEKELEVNQSQVTIPDGLKRHDIENLEVLIAQLQIKIESLDSISRDMPPPVGSLSKEDLEPLEEKLRNIQAGITIMATDERLKAEKDVKHDDFVALETLVRNAKATIDAFVFPTDKLAQYDQLDSVETLLRNTKDSLEELSTKVESEGASKDDVTLIESLLKDIRREIEEIREPTDSEGGRVTKLDIEALATICIGMKDSMPDPDALPTKSDMLNLGDQLKDYRDKNSEDMKSFEDRDFAIAEKLDVVKLFLDVFKDEVTGKIEGGALGVDTIGHLLQEALGKNGLLPSQLKDLSEAHNKRFDLTDAGIETAATKFDKQFTEMMTKFDDVQQAASSRDTQKDNILLSTKEVAEELKIIVDTLGVTVTESSQRFSEDTGTLYAKVDDVTSKLEQSHLAVKGEHDITRGAIQSNLTAINALHGDLKDQSPKILNSVRDTLLLVAEHYDHGKQFANDMRAHAATVAAAAAAAPLPQPEQGLLREIEEPQIYDDTEVRSKLDQLLDHATSSSKSFEQMNKLDQIHDHVKNQSLEMSEFLAATARLITHDHESKERKAEVAGIELERRTAQKEHIESEISSLTTERDNLHQEIDTIRAEKDSLAAQKLKLANEVAGLETALKIRHEELVHMESRAHGLERRILEGVIDQSRAQLLSKGPKLGKGAILPSRRRVPSSRTASSSTAIPPSTTTSSLPPYNNLTHAAIKMATKSRPPPIRKTLAPPLNGPANNGARRILSLSQITANVPTGSHGYSSHSALGHSHASNGTDRSLASMKRSHSVRVGSGAVGLRKSSWNGAPAASSVSSLGSKSTATSTGTPSSNISTATPKAALSWVTSSPSVGPDKENVEVESRRESLAVFPHVEDPDAEAEAERSGVGLGLGLDELREREFEDEEDGRRESYCTTIITAAGDDEDEGIDDVERGDHDELVDNDDDDEADLDRDFNPPDQHPQPLNEQDNDHEQSALLLSSLDSEVDRAMIMFSPSAQHADYHEGDDEGYADLVPPPKFLGHGNGTSDSGIGQSAFDSGASAVMVAGVD